MVVLIILALALVAGVLGWALDNAFERIERLEATCPWRQGRAESIEARLEKLERAAGGRFEPSRVPSLYEVIGSRPERSGDTLICAAPQGPGGVVPKVEVRG